MSRTGVEPKPPWRAVPVAVRHAVEAMLGKQATVSWKAADGRHEAPLRGLIQGLQQALFPES